MPHIQGYVYESYHCEYCGSNLWWPGSTCPECKGEGKADFTPPPVKDGPPIQPQPWQIDSRDWNKQDKEARAQRAEERGTAFRAKRERYDHYRRLCIPYKLLVIKAPVEYADRAIRVLSASYDLVIRQVSETPQGEMATAIVSCENVYQPNWNQLFDTGWRPAKPPVFDSDPQESEASELSRDLLSEPVKQPLQEPSMDNQNQAEWDAYTKAECLNVVHSEPEVQGASTTANTEAVKAVTGMKDEETSKSKEIRHQKWDKANLTDKNFWKQLKKDAD